MTDDVVVRLDAGQADRISRWLYCLADLIDDESSLPEARAEDRLTDVQVMLMSRPPALTINRNRREFATRVRDEVAAIRRQMTEQMGDGTPVL